MTLQSKIRVALADTFRVALVGAAVASATLLVFEREDGGTTAVIRDGSGSIRARTDWTYGLKMKELVSFVQVNTGAESVRLTHVRSFWETDKLLRLQHIAGV